MRDARGLGRGRHNEQSVARRSSLAPGWWTRASGERHPSIGVSAATGERVGFQAHSPCGWGVREY
jgi:hypothetical protein